MDYIAYAELWTQIINEACIYVIVVRLDNNEELSNYLPISGRELSVDRGSNLIISLNVAR